MGCGVEPIGIVLDETGQPRGRFCGPVAEDVAYQRQQLPPYSAAGIVTGLVGSVETVRLSALFQIGYDFGTTELQQRVDRTAMDGADTAQTVESGTTEQPHDHGFGLVVAVVTRGDAEQLVVGGKQIGEETAAQDAARLLEAKTSLACQRARVGSPQVQR